MTCPGPEPSTQHSAGGSPPARRRRRFPAWRRPVLGLWSRAALAVDSRVAQDSGGWGGITLANNVGSPDEVDAVLAEAQ